VWLILRRINFCVHLIGVIVVIFIIAGCVSLSPHKKKLTGTPTIRRRKDAFNTIKTVSEVITGKKLNEDEVVNLTKSIVKDKEAQTVIKEIGDAVIPGKVKVKYSPVTGKRYSANMEYCPETGVKLLPVE